MESLLSLFTIFKDLWLAGQSDLGNLHPLVVHFPFALLFLAPFFILGGLFFPKLRKAHSFTALALMVAGLIFILLSTATGEIAAEKLSPVSATLTILEQHLELAEQSRTLFLVLTALFAIYVFKLPFVDRKLKPAQHRNALLSFIFIYGYALLVLGNAAHQGGKLVHQAGIKSHLYQQATDK